MTAKWVDCKTVPISKLSCLSFRDVLAHYGIEEHGKGDQIKIVCPFHDDHKPFCGVNLVKEIYSYFSCGVNCQLNTLKVTQNTLFFTALCYPEHILRNVKFDETT